MKSLTESQVQKVVELVVVHAMLFSVSYLISYTAVLAVKEQQYRTL